MDQQQSESTTNHEEMAKRYLEDTQQRLQAIPGATKAAAKWSCKGNLVIIVSLIGYVHVVLTVEFSNGQKLRFEGNGGGLIVGGGGVSYGAGWSTRSPDELIAAGNMPFALQATPAGVALEFPGGAFAGGGPNIASGQAWGSGRWTKA